MESTWGSTIMNWSLFFKRCLCSHIWATVKKKELRYYEFSVNGIPSIEMWGCTEYALKQKCLKCTKRRVIKQDETKLLGM